MQISINFADKDGKDWNIGGDAKAERTDGGYWDIDLTGVSINGENWSDELGETIVPLGNSSFRLADIILCEAIHLSEPDFDMIDRCGLTGLCFPKSDFVELFNGAKAWRGATFRDSVDDLYYPLSERVECTDYSEHHISNVEKCDECGGYYLKGKKCENCYIKIYGGEWIKKSEAISVSIGGMRTYDKAENKPNYRHCVCCGRLVPVSEWHEDFQTCDYCEGEQIYPEHSDDDDCDDDEGERDEDAVIAGYHNNPLGRDPHFFGTYERGKFKGIGVELEVGGNPRSHGEQCRYNNIVAKNICKESGLASNQVWFERDGSLDDVSGFESITAPHTVKAFWDNTEKWAKMLDWLAKNGFNSHNNGRCGLHVHVSRLMFGDTQIKQDNAIAKLFAFYEKNWEDLKLASRRKNFDYCELNRNRGEGYEYKTSLKEWRELAKRKRNGIRADGGSYTHGFALNNTNYATVEFRLGRGTLNKASFFAWIDLCVVLSKNAVRITNKGADENDVLNWLKGLKESSARYLYRRGAFKATLESMFPNLPWELDTTDQNERA